MLTRMGVVCVCILLFASVMTGQQVGPCGSNQCGNAADFTASINCGLCNSGYFVLRCTCCSLRQPPECNRELNLCSTFQGSCQTSVCAKCCSQDNVPSGQKTCICLKCTGNQCKDPDCVAGGSAAFERRAAAPVLIQDERVPLEFVQDSAGLIRFTGASVHLEGETVENLRLFFDGGTRLLAYMIMTVEFLGERGETGSSVVTVDRTFLPGPVRPNEPIVIAASASGRSRPARIAIRLDYVRFLGESPGGLYASTLDEALRAQKRAVLAEIRLARSRVNASMPRQEALAQLPTKAEFGPFREVLLQQGVPALLGELSRVEAVLAELGVR